MVRLPNRCTSASWASAAAAAPPSIYPRRREVRALRDDVLDGPDVMTHFLDPEVGPGLFGHGVLCQRRQHEAGYIGILDVEGPRPLRPTQRTATLRADPRAQPARPRDGCFDECRGSALGRRRLPSYCARVPRVQAVVSLSARADTGGGCGGTRSRHTDHTAGIHRLRASRAHWRTVRAMTIDLPAGGGRMLGAITATMADVEEVEVVVAHNERATLRVGDVFLKIDGDQTRTDVEVEAMAMAPIPTPEVLWRQPPVLALAAIPGTALGRLGEPSIASSAAWAAAGAAVRMLHDAPLPPWPGSSLDELASHLDGECEWLVTNGVLPTDVVTRNRRIAEAALRPWVPVFTHGDLQVTHVFVDGDGVTGVIDWSEARQGDALYDLASLTLGHEAHLGDVVAGYGTEVDLDVIRAWWSLRSLRVVRWLVEHGFDPSSPGCEFDVLRSRM
jgi:aminoglycoside phosphotransferase